MMIVLLTSSKVFLKPVRFELIFSNVAVPWEVSTSNFQVLFFFLAKSTELFIKFIRKELLWVELMELVSKLAAN